LWGGQIVANIEVSGEAAGGTTVVKRTMSMLATCPSKKIFTPAAGSYSGMIDLSSAVMPNGLPDYFVPVIENKTGQTITLQLFHIPNHIQMVKL
jgi:hypothetical protein